MENRKIHRDIKHSWNMGKETMHHTYKRKQLICALNVTVFALVTVLEPITAVAAEMDN